MGFAELFVIAIVGLIVIGPEKLPQTIKTALIWFGRVKRLINETRGEFEQQLGVDEIRREIHNEEIMESLKSLKIAKEAAESETVNVGQQISDAVHCIKDDFDPEDEGLFGEQHCNHPTEHNSDESPKSEPR